MRHNNTQRSLILVLAIVLIPLLFIAQSTEPILRSLERAYDRADVTIDLDNTLKTFKAQLIQKQVLTQLDLENPSKIYQKLNLLLPNVRPQEFDIPAFISKAPLTSFLGSQDVLNASISDQSDIALFTYYQLFSEKYAQLELYLEDTRLIQFKGEDLPINSFEAVLFEEINNRKDKNVSINNINIIFKADPATPTEFVSFVRTKLASMGLRGITFSR